MTARQRARVLRLVAKGDTNRSIAEKVGVSARAVEWTIEIERRKRGLRSKALLASSLRDRQAE